MTSTFRSEKKDSSCAEDEFIYIRINPAVRDCGEVNSLLVNSLRILFGDCHYHCASVLQLVGSGEAKERAVIQTTSMSTSAVCASLILPTPPSFMKEYYCIDILQVERKLTDLKL